MFKFSWLQKLALNVPHKFSSTQIQLPKSMAASIIKWGKDNIPDFMLYTEDKGDYIDYGRETDIHTTVFYGLHTSDWKDVENIVKDFGSFEITLDKVSMFDTNPDFDVLKIDVESTQLRKLNKIIQNNLKNTNKYPIYKPHVTIAYIKKGFGTNLVGKLPPVEKSFKATEIIFSYKIGKKHTIKLS